MIGKFKFGSTVVVVLELEDDEKVEKIKDGKV